MITIIAKYNQDMKLKKLLDNANYLSITVDLWTDRRMRAFSGVTDYFLDFDCVLHALLLDFLQFKSPHTEENICNTTRKNLDNLKIKDKVQWIIADNASNMIKAFKFYLNVNDDTTVNCQASGTSRAWSGANSFFAWTLPQDDQITLINTLRAKNVRVIRIFLATIDSGQAGSRALAANDIE
ncbi:unnamed protein product [Adineta steineri]|uniref:Uncharacterized protein n=1 Tax=Adineta steineri TaxID=433720 RepID=A0A819ECU1_9BILA|nr:unnamed protein product [Adineta steineri]